MSHAAALHSEKRLHGKFYMTRYFAVAELNAMVSAKQLTPACLRVIHSESCEQRWLEVPFALA